MIAGNLFTRDYLVDGIVKSDQWSSLTDVEFAQIRADISQIFERFRKIHAPNEAQTERSLIYPILELLGWKEIEVQQNLSTRGRKQVPDAILFRDSDARNLAVSEKDQWRRYQHALAILEAKRWGRALDRADKQEPQEEGVPSTQMLQYLSRVDVQTSGRVRLGILSNGRHWRLYFQGALSVSEDYFELDLHDALSVSPTGEAVNGISPEHALRLFILIYRKAAFLQAHDQRTFHDLAREEGKSWEARVARDLSRLVFQDIYPNLVTAIHERHPRRLAAGEDHLREIREAALVLLYRLLFVVYAEDRDLLPDSKEPYKSYSLTSMRQEIASKRRSGQIFSQSFATYWSKLKAVFRAIDVGDDELGIPPYNGGLFSDDAAPVLNQIELPDGVLANLIFKLSHRDDEGGMPRYINYRDLSVQQLGSIYERTLEFDLVYDEVSGKISVDADDSARHESGSYYTPDNLVSLIIEKSVGPLVEDRLSAFRVAVEELANDDRSVEARLALLQGLDPALAILELRICDPSMGSGHFLVNLVDWLADRVLAAIAEAELLVDWADRPYRSPVLATIDQTRSDIIRQATIHKWPFVVEQLDDRHIIRRTVLKRCIYGVDKSPMAVELAKVALWLHTFTVGAPLSFLDHHLRCGNTLFGSWLHDAADRLSSWGGQLLISEPMRKAMAQALAMQRLERVNDIDIAEVHQSKVLFDGIEQETRPLNTFLQILLALDWLPLKREGKGAVRAWLDGQFGDPIDVVLGRITLGSNDSYHGKSGSRDGFSRLGSAAKEVAGVFARLLTSARQIVDDEKFHNWQVAFPGVWSQWDKSELIGGFDAVIGNPPYVRAELITKSKPHLRRSFPTTYDGKADLFVYFYDQGLKLLKTGGRLSFVVTNKWLRAGYGEGLRAKFSTDNWVEFIADFGHAKKFFPDADVFPSVIVVRRPTSSSPPEHTAISVIPRDEVPQKDLGDAVAKATFLRRRESFGRESWILETRPVMDLYAKLFSSGPSLAEYVGMAPMAGIKTGLNSAYIVNAETRDRLVSDDPRCEKLIVPFLRGQDVKRWHSVESGLYMIVMKSSADADWLWADSDYLNEQGSTAEEVFKREFSSLYSHFKPLEPQLRRREDQGRNWWELRPSQNYAYFGQDYIAYQDIAYHSAFARVNGSLPEMTAFCIPSSDPYLLAVLNSPIMWHLMSRITLHGKDEALRLKTDKVSTLPIPRPSEKDRDDAHGLTVTLKSLVGKKTEIRSALRDWLQHTFEVSPQRLDTTDFTLADEDKFTRAVSAVARKHSGLTLAELSQLKKAFRDTYRPLEELHRDSLVAERKLATLVNNAYQLDSSDVALMWRTAPPRMPFQPEKTANEGND